MSIHVRATRVEVVSNATLAAQPRHGADFSTRVRVSIEADMERMVVSACSS